MHTFSDTAGRNYIAQLSVAVVVRMSEAGIDIHEIATGKLVADSIPSLKKIVNAIWLAVEKSAKVHGVTDEEFGESLGGDSLDSAINALMDAIADFIRPSARTAFKALMAKAKEVETLQAAQALQQIQAASAEAILTSLNIASDSPASSV